MERPLRPGEHVVIHGIVEHVEDVGNGMEVVTVKLTRSSDRFPRGHKIGIWVDFCERHYPPPPQPPAQITLTIVPGTPVNA